MKKSIFVILLCVVCFCVFYGIRYIENPVATQKIVSEVYENKIDTSGYIVRTEQVYTAPASGTIYHYIQEGTRVKRNSVLSTVYTGDISEETLQELNNVNKRISEMTNSDANSYTVAASSGQANIENIKNNIISAKQNGDVSGIADYKAQINGIITGDIAQTQSDSVENLLARKQQLESSLAIGKNDIYSQMSGVFSKNVDGLEEILTPKNVLNYKLDDYESIKDAVKEYINNAAIGQPVCKVVNNHIWYVILTIDRSAAESLKVGTNVKMRFDYLPGIEADASIEYISTESADKDKNVVVLKCEEYKEGVFSIRFSKIELILESYEGYRVPVSAIRNNGDEKGVMVKTATSEVYKPCNVIYNDTADQTIIITSKSGASNPLREYDNIIVGEK